MSDILTKNDSPVNALLWTREEEELLKDWSDIANRFRWLHERSSLVFKKKNNKIALPVIVISTLTGTANFGINSLVPASFIQTAQVVIGGANIICGILTTIQTYFKYAENTEAHANAAKLWAKFQSIIAIELAIEPGKRKHPTVFLKFCIEEYNKLKEYSPQIPPEIATIFKSTFRRKNIKLPDIYDEINPTMTYSDYVSRNIKPNNNKDNSEISEPKTPSSALYDSKLDIDDLEANLRRIPSAFNHRPVKELANNFRNNLKQNIKNNVKSLDLDDISGISVEGKISEVKKATLNQKNDIQNELANIKPNVKGLISSLKANIGTALNNQINEINKNIKPIDSQSSTPRSNSPQDRTNSIFINSDTEINKTNLKNI